MMKVKTLATAAVAASCSEAFSPTLSLKHRSVKTSLAIVHKPAMKAMLGGGGTLSEISGNLSGMNPDDLSPEQTKKMLKSILEMKKQGFIPKKELDGIREYLKDMTGTADIDLTSIEDPSLSPEEKEKLTMLKSIMED